MKFLGTCGSARSAVTVGLDDLEDLLNQNDSMILWKCRCDGPQSRTWSQYFRLPIQTPVSF